MKQQSRSGDTLTLQFGNAHFVHEISKKYKSLLLYCPYPQLRKHRLSKSSSQIQILYFSLNSQSCVAACFPLKSNFVLFSSNFPFDVICQIVFSLKSKYSLHYKSSVCCPNPHFSIWHKQSPQFKYINAWYKILNLSVYPSSLWGMGFSRRLLSKIA